MSHKRQIYFQHRGRINQHFPRNRTHAGVCVLFRWPSFFFQLFFSSNTKQCNIQNQTDLSTKKKKKKKNRMELQITQLTLPQATARNLRSRSPPILYPQKLSKQGRPTRANTRTHTHTRDTVYLVLSTGEGKTRARARLRVDSATNEAARAPRASTISPSPLSLSRSLLGPRGCTIYLSRYFSRGARSVGPLSSRARFTVFPAQRVDASRAYIPLCLPSAYTYSASRRRPESHKTAPDE